MLKQVVMQLDNFMKEKEDLIDLLNYQENMLVNGLNDIIVNEITNNKLSQQEIKDLFKDTQSEFFESQKKHY